MEKITKYSNFKELIILIISGFICAIGLLIYFEKINLPINREFLHIICFFIGFVFLYSFFYLSSPHSSPCCNKIKIAFTFFLSIVTILAWEGLCQKFKYPKQIFFDIIGIIIGFIFILASKKFFNLYAPINISKRNTWRQSR